MDERSRYLFTNIDLEKNKTRKRFWRIVEIVRERVGVLHAVAAATTAGAANEKNYNVLTGGKLGVVSLQCRVESQSLN